MFNLTDCNPSQREAVTFGEGPLLLLAGPGSGKTFTITKRILWLIHEKEVAPEQILVITFTREAVLSMQQRFAQTSSFAGSVNFGTFHSIFYQILLRSGRVQPGNLLNERQKLNLIYPILKKNKECSAEIAKSFLDAIAYYKNTGEKEKTLEKIPEENYWRAYIQMEYLTELMDYAYPEEEDLESSNLESSDSQNQDFKFTEERMNQEEIIRLGIEICQALEVCHKENVLHRDIKPENIMVAKDGTFKLGDFGLAREWDDGSMTVIGTRNYMAPEVYNTFYDKSADIYSLGMVLYYFAKDMRLPFWDLHDSVAQMNARCKGELPEPKTAFEPLRRIILKACAFEPKDRYQSAADMRADLENAKSIGNKEKEIRKYV